MWLVPLWIYSVFFNAFLHQDIATRLMLRLAVAGSPAEASLDVASVIYRSAVFAAFQVITFSKRGVVVVVG